MQIKYLCPFWGSETIGPEIFIERVMEAGFDGVEVVAFECKNEGFPEKGIISRRKTYCIYRTL